MRTILAKKRWSYEQRAKAVIDNFQKGNMEGQYVSSCQKVLSKILEMILPGATVVRGDDVTLEQIGLF